MAHDPDEEEVYGSLVEMFPQIASTTESIPLLPVHARALAFEEGAALTLAFIVWSDPGGARVLRHELGLRIEAALLSVLSRTAATINEEGERRPAKIRLFSFVQLSKESEAALAPFGLRAVPYQPASFAPTMALIRGEATRCGAESPDTPTAIYEVEVAPPDGLRGENLALVESVLRDSLDDLVWGDKPGTHYVALSTALGAIDEAPLSATADALDRIEAIASQLVPGRIRWIPPLVFQALCDGVGVIANKEFGRKVDWAPCDPDEDGLAPPPLLRAKLDDGTVHIPIGEHLLRWSIMPLAEGEVPPPLSDWMLDQFGRR